jgi:hypothetical protein
VLYDEAKVPAYTLPDPLVTHDGRRVRDAEVWNAVRRPEILEMYRAQVFGRSPGTPSDWSTRVEALPEAPSHGKRVTLAPPGGAPQLRLQINRPPQKQGRVPVIVALSFTETTNVATAPQWQLDRILARGYALATMFYGDIEPDSVEGIAKGVRPLFFTPGQSTPAPDEWGALAAWAWGLSRAMDYVETDPDLDASRVVLMGHSRLGKASLWAAALDPRFALVISNESGEGGAAISRRLYGERTADLNRRFPHWFAGNFKQFDHREHEMPFDAHMLLALLAPRPLYVASAEEDRWADPRGEFLAAMHASRVYELFGLRGITTSEMPAVHQPVGDVVRYHVRGGKHDVTAYDWEQYLNFADEQFRK